MDRETTYRTGTRGRSVVMVTYPDAHILDVVGPLEVLTGAKFAVAAVGAPVATGPQRPFSRNARRCSAAFRKRFLLVRCSIAAKTKGRSSNVPVAR